MNPESFTSPPLRRSDRVLVQKVDGSVVLLHLDDGSYFALEGVGVRFWELLDGQTALPDIAARIATEYGVPRDRVEQDLVELATNLADERLVERHP